MGGLYGVDGMRIRWIDVDFEDIENVDCYRYDFVKFGVGMLFKEVVLVYGEVWFVN